MFEAVQHSDIPGARPVGGRGGAHPGRIASIAGPEARERAEAYVTWLDAAETARRGGPG